MSALNINLLASKKDRLFFSPSYRGLGTVICNGHWMLFGDHLTSSSYSILKKLTDRVDAPRNAEWRWNGYKLELNAESPPFNDVIPSHSLGVEMVLLDDITVKWHVASEMVEMTAFKGEDACGSICVSLSYFEAMRAMGCSFYAQARKNDDGELVIEELSPILLVRDEHKVSGVLMPIRR